MREIKFRAWKDKKMSSSFSLEDYSADQDAEYGNYDLPNDFSEDGVFLMQYTGLKDKNGKEIYEGDIIKHDYRDTLTVIEWRDKDASWSMGGYQPENTEIMGNIYENKEILK
jgi:uncharacterized phage protein (TIGR01671 family)